MMNHRRIAAGTAFALALSLLGTVQAQQAVHPPSYVPVLPAVKARALAVDPAKGYLVKEVKPGVFVITDGVYQSAFVTTGEGVVVFDAPESFGGKIAEAVATVTNEPITQLVYSHTHVDHIAGGSALLRQVPGLRILAEAGAARFLREKKDPRRPVPTETFEGQRTLRVGSATIELRKGRWHSPEGDLFIYLPDKKVLIAIDTLAAGHVPFMDFDLSTNMHAYLGVFDELLAYDFDTLVAGHLTYLADRSDVEMSKAYTMDVYTTVKRIHDGTDQMAVMSQAAARYSWDNKFALFRTLLDGVVDQCASEVQGRWIEKLAGVDVFTASHCRAALIYARWDD